MSAQLTQINKKSNFAPAAELSISRKSADDELQEEHPQTDAALQQKSNFMASNGGVPPGSGDGENTLHNSTLFDYLKVHPKLTIGQPNDKYEQEADRVADQVMSMPANDTVQRSCSSCIEEENSLQTKSISTQITPLIQRQPIEEELQTKTTAGITPEVTPAINSGIQSMQGGGRPFSGTERGFFEPRFKADFSDVRVHNDAQAASVARTVNARAFTHGQNVVFGAGEFSPNLSSGRALIAHELTHVIQQKNGMKLNSIQRICNTAKVNARTSPANFPMQADIIAVYNGAAVISSGSTKKNAVLLIQQSLADLNYDLLGKTGKHKEGVDGSFKGKTTVAVKKFQKDEGILESGNVDKQTIRCLDESRFQKKLPDNLDKPIQQTDVEVKRERNSSGMEIFFERNKSALDGGDKKVIGDIATKFEFKRLDLIGFQSEDEVVNVGTKLAKKRAEAVSNELKNRGHALGLPIFKDVKEKPEASIGLSDYPGRRKVQVVERGKPSPVSDCAITPPGWPANDKGRGPCDKGDKPTLGNSIVKPAITKSQKLVKKAYDELSAGNSNAKKQVETWFGSKSYLTRVKNNMKKWKEQVDIHIPAKHLCANDCHAPCDQTDAYNNGRGAAATMTLCKPMFKHGRTVESRGETIVHEAGHGAIGTDDVAYDTTRLINVINKKSSLALINTDSYVRMILCLNGKSCSLPAVSDTFAADINKTSDQQKVIESLSYLERWTDWAWQDLNNLYATVEKSRIDGKWPNDPGEYNYLDEMKILFKTFGWHRPKDGIAATTREKIFVSSVHERLLRMTGHTQRSMNYHIKLDKSVGAKPIWQLRPSREVTLTKSFFKLSKRNKVRHMLKLLIEAEGDISQGLVSPYQKLVERLAVRWHRVP